MSILEEEDEWWRANRDHTEVFLEDFVVLRDLVGLRPTGSALVLRTREALYVELILKAIHGSLVPRRTTRRTDL